MNIYEMLKQVNDKKAKWFKWKFDLYNDGVERTKEHMQRILQVKDIDEWEKKFTKSEEYKRLVILYLDAIRTNDLLQMYTNVKDKAIEGDEKAINAYLKLDKEIQLRKDMLSIKTSEPEDIDYSDVME